MTVTAMRAKGILRLLALLLTAVVLAGCGRSVLYSQLNETQANEVLAELIDHGVDARKEADKRGEGWQVLVNRGDMPAAMAVLHNAGLPHKSADIGAMFEKKGFVSSPLEDKQRYIYAREQQLGRTLRQLDGVVDAYVFLSIPDSNPISDEPVVGSASVILIVGKNADVKSQEMEIKAAVMNGTRSLTDTTRVSVTTFRRNPTPVSMPETQTAGLSVDVGSAVLIALAGLAVLFAVLLLWRNRKSLVSSRGARVISRNESRNERHRER